ncbi:MAG TPA: DUF4397 domain-containing protein [Myxococcota bacterium]|nr:DUF4397 domain-containing protein [Myxococcota bacterium]
MKKISSIIVASAFSILVVNGCGSSSDPIDDVIPDTTEPEKALLRAIHLSPDAPEVDIFANEAETAVVTGLAFGEGTGYLELIPGNWNFDLAPAGSGIGASVLDTGALALQEGKSYTAVAYDTLSALKVMALVDDYQELDEGNIRVRAIHAAAGVGQVDIWNIPATGSPTALYTNVDFGVAGAYMDLPAGAYKLGFDVDNDATPDLVFQTPNLAAGAVINLFAVKSGDEVYLLAQLNDGTVEKIEAEEDVVVVDKTWLRAIHLSQDAPNVDIFAKDAEPAVVTDLAFQEGTGYLELEAGTWKFDLAPAGMGLSATVLDTGDLNLEKDKRYTAVAFNYVSYLEVMALEDNLEGLEAGKIRVRPIHVAPAVGQVDIWNIPAEGDPTALYTDVDFKAVGAYADLPAGAYRLGFDVDNDASPDVIFQTPELAAGTIINLFAVSQGSEVFLIAQLQDGTVARIDAEVMPKAMVRAIHLSPDAPAVDIFANEGEPAVLTGLAFPEGTPYLDVAPGTYNFDISPEGTGLAGSVIDTGDLELEEGKYYTAVAFGEVANLQVLPLIDNYEGLDAGKFRVRPIHAADGVGQVDIWNIPEEGDPAPLYTDVDFGVVGAYADLPAGSYKLGFDVNNDGVPDVSFQTPEIEAGAVINLFAVRDGSEVFLIAQLNDGSTAKIDAIHPPKARVRAIHLSPDAPPVDIFANETEPAVVNDLDFQDSSGFLMVDPGTYNFDLSPADAGLAGSVLDTGDLELQDGVSYTAVAYDQVSALKVMPLVEDFEGLAEGQIRVRPIHAAYMVGQVDIWNIPETGDPAPLYTDVDFGAVGAYVDLPAGAYKLGIDVDNNAVPDLVFQTPDLAAGSIINVFAVQDGDGVFLLAQFQDSFVARINPLAP